MRKDIRDKIHKAADDYVRHNAISRFISCMVFIGSCVGVLLTSLSYDKISGAPYYLGLGILVAAISLSKLKR